MATRSHAVFDTIYIKRMHIINVHGHLRQMQQHIQRLLKSAGTLDIKSPLTAQQIEGNITATLR